MKKISMILMLSLIITGVQGQDYRFGKVTQDELMEENHPVEQDANAAVLYRSVTTYYEYQSATGYSVVTDVHERIKIYDNDGLEWAQKEIILQGDTSNLVKLQGLKASTFNDNNGKITEEKLNKNSIVEENISTSKSRVKFSMPAVREGSVIEYQYTIKSPVISSIEDIALQYTIPINRLEVVVRVPEFLIFEKQLNPNSPLKFSMNESRKSYSYFASDSKRESNYGSGVSASPVSRGTTVSSNVIEYLENVTTIQENMVPPIKEEPYIDNISNYAAYLSWNIKSSQFPNAAPETFSNSWENVGRSIYRDHDYKTRLNDNNYFRKEIDNLITGESNMLRKAEKIYNFARTKAEWNSRPGIEATNAGARVFMNGNGNSADINIMLTAMLQYAGLNASPVLVSTRENGMPTHPTARGFNYVISAVEMGDEIYLLDATDKNAAFGELPSRARNWNGLMIRGEDNMAWVNLVPKDQAKKRTVLNLQVGQNDIKGKSVSSVSGLYAKTYRDSFNSISSDSYLDLLKKDKGNIVITDLDVENGEPGTDIKESFSFELNDGIKEKNGEIHLTPLLFLAEKENPFNATEREYPVTFDFPATTIYTVNIMVPDGYEVESLPESAIYQLKQDAGIFKFVVVQSGKFIKVESERDFRDHIFAPADYDVLQKFYEEIVQKHSEPIVFKKI